MPPDRRSQGSSPPPVRVTSAKQIDVRGVQKEWSVAFFYASPAISFLLHYDHHSIGMTGVPEAEDPSRSCDFFFEA